MSGAETTNERIEYTNLKFERWLNKDAWSLDEFACLYIGMDPDEPDVRTREGFQEDYNNAVEDIQRAAVVAKVIPYIDPPDAKPGILYGLHRFFPLIPALAAWASKRSKRFPFRVVPIYPTPFAENVDRLRKECSWTFEDLAEAIDVDVTTIYSHMKGTSPRQQNIAAYAVAFSQKLGREIQPSDLTPPKPKENPTKTQP